MQEKFYNSAFTLIEILVVVAIFFIGLLGAFSLALNNSNQVRDNFNRVAAADLAREGVEIVRNIRDTNWLRRDSNVDLDANPANGLQLYTWDTGLSAYAIFAVDYRSNNILPMNGCGSAFDEACLNQPSARLYTDNNGLYSHDNAAGNKSTMFSRAINLKAICLPTNGNNPANETFDCSSGEKIGYQVISRVQYTYAGRTIKLDAVENIYNWR